MSASLFCAMAHLDASVLRHHDAFIRTTLTLDPDVASALKERAKREDKPYKQVVNDLLRLGMAREGGGSSKKKKFKVRPHKGGFRPGVDLLKLNQLADDLEAEAFIAKPSKRRGRRA